jgi:glucosamine--fructose-6-phosphate aminotransferase (isomerizing)
MAERGFHTFAEISSQAGIWAYTVAEFQALAPRLGRFLPDLHPSQAIFTGCGSTYYLSLTAAALFQALNGVTAQARPASELVIFPTLVFASGTPALLVAISRSGETTETLDALEVFRRHVGGQVLAITCDGASSLAREADFNLTASHAREESVAQTRSFSSMALLAEALAGHLAGHDVVAALGPLPTICQRLLDEYGDLARRLGEAADINRFFFLGSGYLYGIASEAMLKMKEMSLSYSEAFHTLEFRHGPMSMVDEHTLIVGLLSESALRHETAVLRQMHQGGAQVLAISESGSGLDGSDRVHEVVLRSGVPAWARPVLYLPVLHLLAYYRAIANGQDPDRPAHLDAVVMLDSLLES